MGNVLNHVDHQGNIKGATHSIIATIMSYLQSFQKGKEPPSIKWGRSNEPKAIKMFKQYQSTKHNSLKVEKSGLWISMKHPFIAASPDSLISCECCGSGTVEVKCPWSDRDKTVSQFADTSNSFIVNQNGVIHTMLRLKSKCIVLKQSTVIL